MNLIAYSIVLLVFYILTLTIAYGREVFYPLIKTLQQDLWRIQP